MTMKFHYSMRILSSPAPKIQPEQHCPIFRDFIHGLLDRKIEDSDE